MRGLTGRRWLPNQYVQSKTEDKEKIGDEPKGATGIAYYETFDDAVSLTVVARAKATDMAAKVLQGFCLKKDKQLRTMGVNSKGINAKQI